MHMNSAPHLLPEDRPEFERVLGEALRTANERQDPAAAIGRRLNTEQLRTMALAASAAISSCAAAEYQRYVEVRDVLRNPPGGAGGGPAVEAGGISGAGSGLGRGSGTGSGSGAGSGTGSGTGSGFGEGVQPGGVTASGIAAAVGGAREASGAGLLAIFAVLAPVLAGTAAAIFLLIGYLLRYVSPGEPAAAALIKTGWVFVTLTAAAIVVAMAGLLLTALRDGAGSVRAAAKDERSLEVDRAREEWRQALLERGVLPFLREALADPAAARDRAEEAYGVDPYGAEDADGAEDGADRKPDPYGGHGAYGGEPGTESRTPHLGYSRPGFSTEGGPEESTSRPSYESPGYTSPEYGGPEHQPD